MPQGDNLRRSLQLQQRQRTNLNMFEKVTADTMTAIESKFNFASKHVKKEKSLDYKTGAIWHRIANRDTDPRTKILLKRQKLLNRLK